MKINTTSTSLINMEVLQPICTQQDGVVAQLHSFLSSAVEGGEWSGLWPYSFTVRGSSLGPR